MKWIDLPFNELSYCEHQKMKYDICVQNEKDMDCVSVDVYLQNISPLRLLVR